jgi:hypothetical protein
MYNIITIILHVVLTEYLISNLLQGWLWYRPLFGNTPSFGWRNWRKSRKPPVSRSRFEAGTSRIGKSSANHCTVTVIQYYTEMSARMPPLHVHSQGRARLKWRDLWEECCPNWAPSVPSTWVAPRNSTTTEGAATQDYLVAANLVTGCW